MTSVRTKNGRIEPEGGKAKRFGNALPAEQGDDLVTKYQLANFLDGEFVTSIGAFTNIDPDHAIKIKTPQGGVYIPIILP